MDWAHIAQYFTIDVLTDITFSKPFGYLKVNSDLHHDILTVRAYMPVLELRCNIPFINTLLGKSFLTKLIMPVALDRFGFGPMIGVAKEIAAGRFGPNRKVQDDMVGSFVRHDLTEKETESEALLQMLETSCYWKTLLILTS